MSRMTCSTNWQLLVYRASVHQKRSLLSQSRRRQTMSSQTRHFRFIALVTAVTSNFALTTSFSLHKNPDGHFHSYDSYERGLVADPDGYETRNTFQPNKIASSPTSYNDAIEADVIAASRYENDRTYQGTEDYYPDNLAVVYRKHLKENREGISDSHSNARPDGREVFSGYDDYNGYNGPRSGPIGTADYGTYNTAPTRYNTINTGSGWISATTHSRHGNSYLRSDDYHHGGGGGGRNEAVQGRADTKSYSGGPSVYDESSQTPGGGYAPPTRPWYGRQLEGKEADESTSDIDEVVVQDWRQDKTIPKTVILLTAYDPCVHLSDGNYPLISIFQQWFPFVDELCNFVMCAHRTAFLLPCGYGSKNPPVSDYKHLQPADNQTYFCSLTDADNLCRLSATTVNSSDKTTTMTVSTTHVQRPSPETAESHGN